MWLHLISHKLWRYEIKSLYMFWISVSFRMQFLLVKMYIALVNSLGINSLLSKMWMLVRLLMYLFDFGQFLRIRSCLWVLLVKWLSCWSFLLKSIFLRCLLMVWISKFLMVSWLFLHVKMWIEDCCNRDICLLCRLSDVHGIVFPRSVAEFCDPWKECRFMCWCMWWSDRI